MRNLALVFVVIVTLFFSTWAFGAITITNPGTGTGTIKLYSTTPPNALLLESCDVGSDNATCRVGVSQATASGNVIQAVAGANSFFAGWSDTSGVVSDCDDANKTCKITGSAVGRVKATFTACTVAINPNNRRHDWSGGTANITITTNDSSCSWSARSNSSWITLSGSGSGSGSAALAYSVSYNMTSMERTGTIEVSGNVFTVTQGAYLPSIIITPDPVEFGTVKTGQLSERQVTIKNIGASNTLQINDVQISGQTSSDFGVAHNCSSIQPYGSCAVRVSFSPSSTGTKSATLSVNSNDAYRPSYEVTVTGTGSQSVSASIAVNPNTFNLTPIDIEIGHEKGVNITNNGTGSLLIQDIRMAGRNASEFSVSNTCPIVQPGESCTVAFRGHYTSNNPKEVSLVIRSNAQNHAVVEVPISVSSPNCLNGTITLSETSKSINQDASSYSTQVTKTGESGCIWLTTSPASWLSASLSGTVLNYSAQANNSNQLRMANIKVSGEVFTVIQHKDANNRTFDDIAGNYFTDYINAIYSKRITIGCIQDTSYCPLDYVTRGQMAAFIIRALQGEDINYTQTPYYTDVPSGHNFFKYVQKMRDLGITVTTGTYGVNDYVTRGQMAAFIIRAIFGEDFSYTQTPYFYDVPSNHTFFRYVQKMKDAGITAITGSYRVDDYVTRQEMAAFLARAFLGMR